MTTDADDGKLSVNLWSKHGQEDNQPVRQTPPRLSSIDRCLYIWFVIQSSIDNRRDPCRSEGGESKRVWIGLIFGLQSN